MNIKSSKLTPLLMAAVLLAASPSAWSLPPRQHSVSGVVEAIDCATRTITLRPKGKDSPVTFDWNDNTRFTKQGGCAECGLKAGQSAKLSYRREVGRNVLREVNTKGTTTECGAGCK